MYCHTLVSPGIGATVHTFFFRKVLMIEDLPVLGYPMNPTEICLRSECKEENCLNNWIKEPLPKEFVMDAWNASVGRDFDKCLTHAACKKLVCQTRERKAAGE